MGPGSDFASTFEIKSDRATSHETVGLVFGEGISSKFTDFRVEAR